jgi:hypothetical protein
MLFLYELLSTSDYNIKNFEPTLGRKGIHRIPSCPITLKDVAAAVYWLFISLVDLHSKRTDIW